MKIVGLYEANGVYQVMDDSETTVWFQGTKAECQSMLEDMEYEDMAHRAFYSTEL